MQVCTSTDVYNPLAAKTPFRHHFFTSDTEEQQELADRVIAHLETLDEQQLNYESQEYYKYTVKFHVSYCHLHYADTLLHYFQSKGLLKYKQAVNTVQKQQKKRYLVMFDLNDKVVTQTYNSIREVKADTGKKPSQIKPELMQELFQTI
jgi:hypothetical protein